MCYGITKDKEQIDDAVQELMMYFMQMNPTTLKSIWEKDGQEGIIRYGAVVLRRALTSKRSPFFYQYKKYYTYLDKFSSDTTYDITETGELNDYEYFKDHYTSEIYDVDKDGYYDIVLIGESEEQSLLNLINNHCQGVMQTIQEVKVVIHSFDGLHCLELYLHHSIDKNNYRFFEKLSGNFYIGRPLKINLGKVKISIEIESTS